MTLPDWHEEAIARNHDRKSFDCADSVLNDYLRKFARQNHESGGAKTFLAIDDADGKVLGYYSVAPASAIYEQMPGLVRKGLPRHPVPGFRLARLAIDKTVQGKGLGTQLLLIAAKRCLQVAAAAGGIALFLDAKTERAAQWYEERGATRLVGIPEGFPVPMVIPLQTLKAALEAAGRL